MIKKTASQILAFSFFLLLIPAFYLYSADPCFSQQEDDFSRNLYRARVFFNLGRYQQAIEEYKRVDSESQYYKNALLNKALIYKNMINYDKAILEYKKLLNISPNKFIYKKLGEVYILNSQPDHAITAFSKALQLKAKDAWIYFWIAKAYEEKKDFKNAVWAYEQALKINPDIAQCHYNIGTIHFKNESWQKSQFAFEKAKELDPSLPNLDYDLAVTLFEQDSFDRALSLFKKAKAVNPEDKTIQRYMNLIHKKAGKSLKDELAKRQKQRMEQTKAQVLKAKKAEKAPIVKVHIGDVKKLRFKTASDFQIIDASQPDTVSYSGYKDALYSISAEQGKICLADYLGKKIYLPESVLIDDLSDWATILVFDVQAGAGKYWASKTDRIYRGKIKVVLTEQSGLRLINVLNMEEYLYGVLPSEMPNYWPIEALKAQAVAARSEAFRKMGRHKDQGFDFCQEVHCQAYSGAKVETKRTNAAVDATYGQAATYKQKPIDAVYSNSCGGHTQGNIFSNREIIEYWKPKKDTDQDIGYYFPVSAVELETWLWSDDLPVFCNNKNFSRPSNFRWMRVYEVKSLENIIKNKFDIGRLLGIKISERNPSSHIHQIDIIGTKGTFTVKKELNIRTVLGNLRSGMFNINVKLDRKKRPKEFIFFGGGWGHGVGMCQVGAASMADKNYDYQDIIHFYFSGIEIADMY